MNSQLFILGASCGYSFCQKCAYRHQRLPQRFGFKNRDVRVCEWCVNWFQEAIEEYMFRKIPAANNAAKKFFQPFYSSKLSLNFAMWS
jgi:hypothetical protein